MLPLATALSSGMHVGLHLPASSPPQAACASSLMGKERTLARGGWLPKLTQGFSLGKAPQRLLSSPKSSRLGLSLRARRTLLWMAKRRTEGNLSHQQADET
jgi:hypothetical protein